MPASCADCPHRVARQRLLLLGGIPGGARPGHPRGRTVVKNPVIRRMRKPPRIEVIPLDDAAPAGASSPAGAASSSGMTSVLGAGCVRVGAGSVTTGAAARAAGASATSAAPEEEKTLPGQE